MARHARNFTWNRGCSSNSLPRTHGDQILHPLEDSDNQIPSSLRRQSCQMPKVCPRGRGGGDVEASIWPIHYRHWYWLYSSQCQCHVIKRLRWSVKLIYDCFRRFFVSYMWKLTMCHSVWKNSSCKPLKAKSVLHGTTWPKIQRFNVAVKLIYTTG